MNKKDFHRIESVRSYGISTIYDLYAEEEFDPDDIFDQDEDCVLSTKIGPAIYDRIADRTWLFILPEALKEKFK